MGSQIKLDSEISSDGFSAFAEFDASELKRVLSNLINNAFEAFPEKSGKITVFLAADSHTVILSVQDNGCGIPQSKIAEAMKGNSLKPQGHGLGLPHAKRYVESLRGQFLLRSTENKGTTVELRLPKAIPPDWFVSELVFSNTRPIAVLDDDQLVHNAWNQRLLSVSSELLIHHFFTTTELSDWYSQQNTAVQILSDYELLGETQSGLDILEKLGIGGFATLVTSYYESSEIITRCQRLGIRLLPKNLLPYVPMRLESASEAQPLNSSTSQTTDCILIDDNIQIHSLWKRCAKLANKNLLVFRVPGEFEKYPLSELSKQTPIYVDSSLGNSQESGEIYAKKLWDQGFTELYLCTGYQASHFGEMPWIKKVVDKSPPF